MLVKGPGVMLSNGFQRQYKTGSENILALVTYYQISQLLWLGYYVYSVTKGPFY